MKKKNNYKNFFNNLHSFLPCQLCSNNYKNHLKIHPLNDITNGPLSTRTKLINWGIDMHNAVNHLHGKKIFEYYDATEEIIKDLKNIYKSNDNNDNSCVCPNTKPDPKIKYIIIFLLIVILYLMKIKNDIKYK